ncbi:hypothetical protein [Paenibacillus naphthalenovorans]|uniref:Uncharacterized protein n=1 Tax=Paenibacillus naphthalenovorans TaxID=162209 RepID=A0A0U2W0Q4_9BACL|nr:hypothetical protein [Paenibacillus naphthalenovorans]ALS22100.1 hypothetical protein IJ22_17260 [Paenibacillus naphthalenovorans]
MKVKLRNITLGTENENPFDLEDEGEFYGVAKLEIEQEVGKIYNQTIRYKNDEFYLNISCMPEELQLKAKEFFDLLKKEICKLR